MHENSDATGYNVRENASKGSDAPNAPGSSNVSDPSDVFGASRISDASDISDAIGREVELEITNVAHGGIFVARHEGRVIFVSDTLPGERVLARISDDTHSSFWRAETLEVLTASPHRQKHIWSAASIDRAPEQRAGGAEFGHIELAHQRELKRLVLTDSLSRFAGYESDVAVETLRGDDESHGTGWRTRARLHVAADGTVGPFASRSHHVIAVADLPLAVQELADEFSFNERFVGAESIDLIAPSIGPARVLVSAAPADRRSADRRSADRRSAGGRSGRPGGKVRGRQSTRRVAAPPPDPIMELVGDREFRLDVRGFWQVHQNAAATLSDAVRTAVNESLFDPRAANLDLYGGVGLLAASLGDRFGRTLRITSVEFDARATDHAATNLAEWVGSAAVTARVDRYLQGLEQQASATERARLAAGTVVLDPPRAGAGKNVVRALGRLQPAQIVYVACDPVALARDVALFAQDGYHIRSLRAFDFFPNTHHVEAVALLARE